MSPSNKIAALILAAGYSSRMGKFKPLLPLNGLTVLEQAILNFHLAGIEDIRVVVGYRGEDLMPVLLKTGAIPIINHEYDQGMYSSIITGLRTLAEETAGFFLLPGDMPLVSSQSIRKLLTAYQETKASVIYPSFLGQRGHPPLISQRCYASILSSEGTGGLRRVLQQFEGAALDVELFDQAILLDLDTPEDYQRITSYLRHQDIPNVDECLAILQEFNVAERVIKHSKAVARIARDLGVRLNEAGYSLNIDLLIAAGLLHDLAKGQPHHAVQGAKILTELNYPRVAQLVAQHMEIDLTENSSLDEACILYLADKLVQEDQIVPIEQRFNTAYQKYASQAEILESIKKRLEDALLIKQKIEYILGISDLTDMEVVLK